MRFKEFLVVEASYKGNIGMMEMFKFHQIASAEEKSKMRELLSAGQQDEAWKLLKKVTSAELVG